MAPTSPTVARWELALRLRQRRDQLGMDVDTITKAMGFNRTYWSHVENDRRVLSEDKLKEALDLFGVAADERDEFLALRADAKLRGWWSAYSGLLGDTMQRFVGLEHGAQSVHCYNSLLIPGLLQTEAYTKALMLAAATIRQFEVNQHVEVRMRRQRRLFDDDPLELTAVIHQAALVQQNGGQDVLREQLKHLATVLSQRENVDVRVIPFTEPAGAALGGVTFQTFSFPSQQLPKLVWHESMLINSFVDDKAVLNPTSFVYNNLLGRALSRTNSIGP